ncbi:MAG TPA: hypothetical protein VGM72_03325 [Micropepsaceae bacterium]
MNTKIMATASIAALLVGLSLPVPAAEQTTIFNTKDFHQDRTLWSDPAYYKNNTAGQLRGMAIGIVPYENTGQVGSSRVYNTEGTGKAGAANLGSPYPFKTAKEHYEAWLKDAHGGIKHTKATIPDWSGHWNGGGGGFGGGGSPASDVVKLLTPKYQEYLVQELKAATEGRIWSANAFCLPNGFFPTLAASEFIATPDRVWTLTEGNGWNGIRWIYTDGSGHTPEDLQFPKWAGESIGFWNGDTLIVYTNQMKAWKGGLEEYTDNLETVEKYRRVGDQIQGEITLYDPEVLVKPVTSRLIYRLSKDNRPEKRPLYNTCSDSNGPSPKVFMDANGLLNEHVPGDPGFNWSGADSRPWGTWLTESDRRYKAYIAAGGKPPGQK